MATATKGRKYSRGASKKVEKVMRERKRGTLRSGGSRKKVTSRKQAIAIGLSEARRAGEQVPPAKGGKKKAASRKRSSAKKKAGSKSRRSSSRRKKSA